MYERILVPIDGGARTSVALDVGVKIAEQWGANLDVLAILEFGAKPGHSQKWIERQTAHLTGVAEVDIRTVEYSVEHDIAAEIESDMSTLAVMATSARSRSTPMIDSVTDDVLRLIDSPALLIGPNAVVKSDWPTGPMFVCTDGSPFAEEIIPHVAKMADGLKVEPWIISVLEPDAVPAGVNQAAETNMPARVAETLSPMVGKDVNYDVLHGDHPAKDIVLYTTNHGASLIAMATHGRTGLKRMALGSVAMGVVHDAACPVLVVRPTG